MRSTCWLITCRLILLTSSLLLAFQKICYYLFKPGEGCQSFAILIKYKFFFFFLRRTINCRRNRVATRRNRFVYIYFFLVKILQDLWKKKKREKDNSKSSTSLQLHPRKLKILSYVPPFLLTILTVI